MGRAGQLLNNMIKAMGLRREEMDIANSSNAVARHPMPERDEREKCSPFLMRQVAVIKPKVLVALGAVAANTLLSAILCAPMSEAGGKLVRLPLGTKLAVTYHPAFCLRDPRQNSGMVNVRRPTRPALVLAQRGNDAVYSGFLAK